MRRSTLIYGIVLMVWFLAVCWQVWEHGRVRENARQRLTSRAQDIAGVMSVVIRSQGRFGAMPRGRIEAAIRELVASTELVSAALLDADGSTVAAGGSPLPEKTESLLGSRVHWQRNAATFVNLVALGPTAEDFELPDPAFPGPPVPGQMNKGELPRFGSPVWQEILKNPEKEKALRSLLKIASFSPKNTDELIALIAGRDVPEKLREDVHNILVGNRLERNTLHQIFILLKPDAFRTGRNRLEGGPGAGGRRPSRFGDDPHWGDGPGFPRRGPRRPPWMDKTHYEKLLEERGVLWFVITISTDAYDAEMGRDLKVRLITVAAIFFAGIALCLAWRQFENSAALRINLARTEEFTKYLRDLNTTAAGLVHETKNPLNIIRGIAQLIARAPEAPEEIQRNATTITEEADRVTGRLNQFLEYARPAQPKLQPIALQELVEEIHAILESDFQEKNISFLYEGIQSVVHADEGMLRQVLFNLILNALQALPEGGHVRVRAEEEGHNNTTLVVADNGPGVAPEDRENIFRPYFTTNEEGTGLGLAVVQQIALAHHWHVDCRESSEGGAAFLIQGMERLSDSREKKPNE